MTMRDHSIGKEKYTMTYHHDICHKDISPWHMVTMTYRKCQWHIAWHIGCHENMSWRQIVCTQPPPNLRYYMSWRQLYMSLCICHWICHARHMSCRYVMVTNLPLEAYVSCRCVMTCKLHVLWCHVSCRYVMKNEYMSWCPNCLYHVSCVMWICHGGQACVIGHCHVDISCRCVMVP